MDGSKEGGSVGGALPLSLFLSLMERLSWQRAAAFRRGEAAVKDVSRRA